MEAFKGRDLTHILLTTVIVLFVLNFYMFVSARLAAAPAPTVEHVDRPAVVCIERVPDGPRVRLEIESDEAERLRRRAAVLRRDAERLRKRITAQQYEMSMPRAGGTSSF